MKSGTLLLLYSQKFVQNACIESHLQPLSNEDLNGASAWRDDGARLNIQYVFNGPPVFFSLPFSIRSTYVGF